MEIKIEYEKHLDLNEFQKAIGFISEDILSYVIQNHEIILKVKKGADCERIKQKSEDLLHKFFSENQNQIYYSNDSYKDYIDVEKLDCIHSFEDGMISLQNEALLLYQYFENEFKKMVYQLDNQYEEKLYPVLLPLKEYKKTGYLENSPQYAMLCSSAREDISILEGLNKNMDTESVAEYLSFPSYALSPSACFHTYIEHMGKNLSSEKIISFTQSVFRNEGRFNFHEIGRLRDYHVREVVFFGNQEFISNKRKNLMDMVIQFIKKLDMCGDISVATDPFIMPKLQKYKKIQLIENSKYELRLNYNNDKKMSVASFNIHGTAFTYPFHISIHNVKNPVTGCAGFGLERWVLAFLAQYGLDKSKWPKIMKQELNIE